MNQRASQNRASGDASPPWGDWEYAPDRIQSVRAQIVVGRQMDKLPVEAEYHTVGRLTQPPRARRDRLEGRLDVRRRATDHLKDLARRRLLLERLGEVAVTSLQLVEEPHVLDGDHGLVCEGLEELDLAFRERPFGLRHDDGADGLAFAQHWHDQQRLI